MNKEVSLHDYNVKCEILVKNCFYKWTTQVWIKVCDCTWILFFLTAVIVTPRRFKVVRGLLFNRIVYSRCLWFFLLSLPKTNNRSRTREHLLAVLYLELKITFISLRPSFLIFLEASLWAIRCLNRKAREIKIKHIF